NKPLLRTMGASRFSSLCGSPAPNAAELGRSTAEGSYSQMRKVFAEFLTTDSSAPDSYGDSGCTLEALHHLPMVLRHEHYTNELRHRVYVFAREPEWYAQVFLNVFPMPQGEEEYEKDLAFYIEQQKAFRLPGGRRF